MDHQWIFEEEERRDILVGIHLLANMHDEEDRAARALSREADSNAWLCKLAEAREIGRRESNECP